MNLRRLYRYRRIFAIMAVGAVAVVSIGATNNEVPPKESIYVVQEGDTLWNVATKYCSDEDNIQEVIWEIKKDNPHIADYLHPGDKLLLKKELLDTGISNN